MELCRNYEGYFPVNGSTWIDHLPRFSTPINTPVEPKFPQAYNPLLSSIKKLGSQRLIPLIAWMTGQAGGIRRVLDELILAGRDAEEQPTALMQHALSILHEFFLGAAGGFECLPDHR